MEEIAGGAGAGVGVNPFGSGGRGGFLGRTQSYRNQRLSNLKEASNETIRRLLSGTSNVPIANLSNENIALLKQTLPVNRIYGRSTMSAEERRNLTQRMQEARRNRLTNIITAFNALDEAGQLNSYNIQVSQPVAENVVKGIDSLMADTKAKIYSDPQKGEFFYVDENGRFSYDFNKLKKSFRDSNATIFYNPIWDIISTRNKLTRLLIKLDRYNINPDAYVGKMVRRRVLGNARKVNYFANHPDAAQKWFNDREASKARYIERVNQKVNNMKALLDLQ